MAEVIRYGIVGTGLMAIEHIQNLAITPGVKLVALADPLESSLNWAKGAMRSGADDVRTFSSSAELAASGSVDAVIVASPNFTHRAVLEPLFDANLHILCEKPVATTISDARWVADRAKIHNGVFWTAMEYRYMPPVVEFIKQLNGGKIGRLQMLSIREHRFPFLPKIGDWNRFSANTGGTMVEKCCHFFDLMRLIVGAEPVRVYCSGAMDVNHLDERYDGKTPDIIDNSFTTIDFSNGVRAMLDLCMFADGAQEQEEIIASGSAARLDVRIPSGEIVYSPRVGYQREKKAEHMHVAVDEAAMQAGNHHGSTFYEHQKFAAAVRGEGQVEVSADDGLRAVAIGTAAEISARERRVVEMAELGF